MTFDLKGVFFYIEFQTSLHAMFWRIVYSCLLNFNCFTPPAILKIFINFLKAVYAFKLFFFIFKYTYTCFYFPFNTSVHAICSLSSMCLINHFHNCPHFATYIVCN